MAKYVGHSGGHNSAIMTRIKFLFLFPVCTCTVLSKLCIKLQNPKSNTVGGVAETRTALQSVTYRRTNRCVDKGETTCICPSPLRGGDIRNRWNELWVIFLLQQNYTFSNAKCFWRIRYYCFYNYINEALFCRNYEFWGHSFPCCLLCHWT